MIYQNNREIGLGITIISILVIFYLLLPFIGCSQGARVEKLIKNLNSEDWRVREKASLALGEIKDAKAVEPLISALKDEAWTVRKEASLALGEIKDTRAVEPLINALRDEDWHAREKVEETLVKIGMPAVEPLINALKDEDRNVLWSAAWALG